MSPFVNSRALGKVPCSSGSGSTGVAATGGADSDDKMMRRWFAVADLSRALHGFLVFEVSWRDVHGINYLNELLTDTSLALEARYMKKWEFYSAEQAASCTPKWFLGRASEAKALRGYLRSLHQQQQEQEQDDDSMLLLLRRACSSPSLRVVSEDTCSGADADPDDVSAEKQCPPTTTPRTRRRKEDRSAEAAEPFVSPAQYSDTLILFRFRDSELPFKLQQIVMSDIRLLTLLESGLPSWVIFFQSYPLFCHLYRPWMRPLARSLYMLVSLVTVIIGFYDLYKNVPLLKAAAARICGPLFGWIETWDMVTRIQYLGTILFLRNLRKCLQGLLTLLRMARALLRPLAELAGPLLDACGDLCEVLASGALSGVGSAWALLVDLAEMLWAPFDLVFDYVVGAVGSLCPLLQVLLLPVRCAVAMASCAGSLLSNSYNFSKDIWETISSIFELNHMSEAQQSAFDMSLLKALWNDLFSQVARFIYIHSSLGSFLGSMYSLIDVSFINCYAIHRIAYICVRRSSGQSGAS